MTKWILASSLALFLLGCHSNQHPPQDQQAQAQETKVSQSRPGSQLETSGTQTKRQGPVGSKAASKNSHIKH